MPNARNFFSQEQKQQILKAIYTAEEHTSGEIRVHIEQNCNEDVLDHAAFIFESLEMHKTKLRNGVLFYLSVEDHKFAVLGDAGINSVVPENFWDSIKNIMIEEFKNGNFSDGLCKGIELTGKELKKYFPFNAENVNELPNEISFKK
jgi:uncharacterized membrane protein